MSRVASLGKRRSIVPATVAESIYDASFEVLVRELARQSGIPMVEAEAAEVATLYREYQQLIDTIEAVDLSLEEEPFAALDLAEWGAPPTEPVSREGPDHP